VPLHLNLLYHTSTVKILFTVKKPGLQCSPDYFWEGPPGIDPEACYEKKLFLYYSDSVTILWIKSEKKMPRGSTAPGHPSSLLTSGHPAISL
jgi:hypothetical protein